MDRAQKTVLRIERLLAEAVLSRDRNAAAAILDDKFLAIGHAGNVVDKRAYLDIHFSLDRRFTRFDTEQQDLVMITGTVVVTGTVTMMNAKLDRNPPPARYTAIYVPGPKDWLLRWWQETPIDPEANF
jgi:Domain of unknown function (DUF4440)